MYRSTKKCTGIETTKTSEMSEPLLSPTLFPIIFESRGYHSRLCCILQYSLQTMRLRVILLPLNAVPYTQNPTEYLPLGYARAFSPWDELYQSRLAHGSGWEALVLCTAFFLSKLDAWVALRVSAMQNHANIPRAFPRISKLKENPGQGYILVESLLLI